MVLGDEFQDWNMLEWGALCKWYIVGELTVGFDDLALAVRHVVYPAMMHLLASAKQTLPAGDWISADNWTVES